MWRTRGNCPFRGLRCCSAGQCITAKAVKSQLHDGRISAEPVSAHADHTWGSVGVHSLQPHLPGRAPEIEHAVSLEGPGPSFQTDDSGLLSVVQEQERLASSPDASERRCDCEPSTSTSRDSYLGSGSGQRDAGGKRRAQEGLSKRDAAVLTRRITLTRTVAELAEVVERYRFKLNHIHTAAAIVKLAKLLDTGPSRQHRQQQQHQHNPQQQQQQQRYGKAAVLRPEDPRPSENAEADGLSQAANASHAAKSEAGQAGQRPPQQPRPQQQQQQLRQQQERRQQQQQQPPSPPLPGPTPSPVPAASLAPSLLSDLTSRFLAQQHHCHSARQFANVVWALGAMHSTDQSELLAAAAVQLLAQGGAKLAAAPPQELSNLALGLAKLGYREVPLWDAIIAAAKPRLQDFKPQELHNLAWGVAAASQDRSMILAVVRAVLPRIRQLNASGLANLLWACAIAQCHCGELFEAAAAQLLGGIGPNELCSQDVANTAWAFAKVQRTHPRLMQYLARWWLWDGDEKEEEEGQQKGKGKRKAHPGGQGARGVRRRPRIRRAPTQELVNMLWAFASMPPLPYVQPKGMVRGNGGCSSGGAGSSAERAMGGDSAGGVAGRGCGEGQVRNGSSGSGCQDVGLPGSGGAGRAGSAQPAGSTAVPPVPVLPWPPPLVGAAAANARGRAASGAASGSNGGPHSSSSSRAPLSRSASRRSSGGNSPSSHANPGSLRSGTYGFPTLQTVFVTELLPELASRRDLTPQGVSNALWSCARLQPCALPPAPLQALLRAAVASAPSMASQELCNTMWAAGEIRDAGHCVPDEAAAQLAAVACSAVRLDAAAPPGLAQLVHGAVKLRLVRGGAGRYMDAIASRVLRSMSALGPQELCVVATAVAEAVFVAEYCNPILLSGLADAAAAQADQLSPQGLSMLLWSFARAQHHHGPLTSAVCRLATPHLQHFSDRELSNLVWALAALQCQERQLLVRAGRVLVARVRLRRQRQQWQQQQWQQQQLQWQLQQGQGQQQQERQQQHAAPAAVTGAVPPAEQQRLQQQRQQQGGAVVFGDGGGEVQRDGMVAGAAAVCRPQHPTGAAGGCITRGASAPVAPHERMTSSSSPSGTSGSSSSGGGSECDPSSSSSNADGMAGHRGCSGHGTPPVATMLPSPLPLPCGSQPSSQPLAASNAPPATPGSVLTPRVSPSSKPEAGRVDPPCPPPSSAQATAAITAPAEAALRRVQAIPHHRLSDDPHVPLQAQRPPPRATCRGTALPAAAAAAASGRRGGCVAGGDAVRPSRNGEGSSGSRAISGSSDAADLEDLDGFGGDLLNIPAAAPHDHAKSMAKLLWGFAKCGMYEQQLYRALCHELRPLLHLLTPHELAQVLWAVSHHGHPCPDLLDVAAVVVMARLPTFCAWDGAGIAWAYGKMRYRHRDLMLALQYHAVALVPYNKPCLYRLAWACAELQMPLSKQLLMQLHAMRQVEDGRYPQRSVQPQQQQQQEWQGPDAQPSHGSSSGYGRETSSGE